MYCSQLLVAKNDLPDEEIQKIDNFLRANKYNPYITISMANKYTNIPENLIAETFNKLCCTGVLKIIYALSCPECGHLIKKIQGIESFDFESVDYCYSCEEDISCSENDVVVLYEQKISFKKGQYCAEKFEINPKDIAPCDTFTYISEISETFRQMLDLEKYKFDEQHLEKENRKKIADIKDCAFKKYLQHKTLKLIIRVSLIFIFSFLLWAILLDTKATGIASVIITVFTYIITNIIDLICNYFIESDLNVIERKEILLKTKNPNLINE